MAYKIEYLGWNNEPGHDKVWGYVTVGDYEPKFYNFWGRRGKRFAFQEHEGSYSNNYALQKKARTKSSNGYNEIAVDKIEEIIPGFFETFEKELVLAKMFENWRGKKEEDDA